jgi:hypothetical protein
VNQHPAFQARRILQLQFYGNAIEISIGFQLPDYGAVFSAFAPSGANKTLAAPLVSRGESPNIWLETPRFPSGSKIYHSLSR